MIYTINLKISAKSLRSYTYSYSNFKISKMAKYWQLNFLIWGQGDIFRKGGTKIKKYFFNKTYQP
jgi:hypothetical protein